MSGRFDGMSEREANTVVCAERAEKYAHKQFTIRLKDRSRVMLLCDRVVINEGSLEFYAGESTELMSCFAAGTWTECHAISVMDNSPILIIDDDRLWIQGRGGSEWRVREREKMTPSLRHDILAEYGHTCQSCGATPKDGAKLHVDHITPIAKGGKTERENLQVLCADCNHGKGAK